MDISSGVTGAVPVVSPAATRRHAIFATVIGSGLEWFDFSGYAFFAAIIGKLFFPAGNETTSLLLALATFGVGFVIRPLGGILFGIYADRAGRKRALSLAMLLMALGSAIIAFAPTYQSIGILAPCLIVLARLLQGISAGGEMGGATAFLTEHAPKDRRATYSSWIQTSVGFAVVIGSLVGTLIVSALPADAVLRWGWRIPFFVGMLIAPVGYYIRLKIDETPEFATQKKHAETPLREVIRVYPRQVVSSLMMVVLWTVCTYVILFYMPTYATRYLGLSQKQGFVSGVVSGVVLMVMAPIVGAFSDRVGKRRVLSVAAVLILVFSYPLFSYLNASRSFSTLLMFQAIFGVLIAGYTGPILALFVEMFPSRVRTTGLSLAYNGAVTIFGGFASFIITWLTKVTGDAESAAYYIVFAAAVSLIGTLLMKPYQS
ncbi:MULTISPECIES: MFS transporter [Paraburkholderia]|uniref:MFS transporter n=1 Tax=Paraburkholderia madseniana TaxID=2599607 RepID=A0AAP5EQS7_9BURK|nr:MULTISPECIES: MFS transporter [Paraburkholderia]MCX4149460.1 MFS transporter [Paraburkholderia madseniana]MDN7152396.1 MFS transporter [Paraburkholderia sp. WS6]MDQ6411278.1 MFS transporter [Paraburkholderia madseniana]